MDEDEEEGEEEEKTARSGEKHVRELTNENLDYVKNQIKQVSLAKLEETKVKRLNCYIYIYMYMLCI